jgi:hypothetical protein
MHDDNVRSEKDAWRNGRAIALLSSRYQISLDETRFGKMSPPDAFPLSSLLGSSYP